MLAGRCTHHPERTAVGVCILCRTPICIECSTPMDGIHRCAVCIAGMEAGRDSARYEGGEASPLVLSILAFSLVGLTLYWLGLAAVVG